MKLKVLDLFSGIAGFSLGLERTGGFETAAFCEINEFCRGVLHKHWPGVPVAADVTKMRFYEGMADVVVGGFPCQDVSCAGKRAGLSGERSGLYRELVRALRLVRPKYAIVENVAALLGDGMGTVLGDMAESGLDLEWDCVPACAIGAPHERDRVYIVAHADNERCGETRQLRHRPFEVSSGRATPAQRQSAGDAANAGSHGRCSAASGELQPRQTISDIDGVCSSEEGRRSVLEPRVAGRVAADPESLGWGPRGTRRFPDSFARVRERARWHSSDPYGSRLSFRDSVGRDAREELSAIERDGCEDERQSLWPDEPALSGVDDGVPDWVERVKATGNAVLPQIPELIGKAILESLGR